MKNKDVELQLLAKEAVFYRDLLAQLNNDAIRGMLIFSLVPYISLFTWELYNYFLSSSKQLVINLDQNFKSTIQSSRHKIKLLSFLKVRSPHTYSNF